MKKSRARLFAEWVIFWIVLTLILTGIVGTVLFLVTVAPGPKS